MISFVPTTFEDVPQLARWIMADPWHTIKDSTDWWIHGYLTFKLVDERGTVIFVRFDREDDVLRLHSQFGPLSEVSERRVASAIIEGINNFIPYAKVDGVTGIITESISSKLVSFLKKYLGFEWSACNDYKLTFSEGQ
jgi:hypothetical protein